MGETDTISRQAAIDALWKALYEYEDETEQKFQASDELNTDDWFMHRIFVQNMSDIDRQTILALPSAQPERKKGKWIYDGDCYICDQCKSAFGWWADSQTSNYCPNCGAAMFKDNPASKMLELHQSQAGDLFN